MLRIAPLPAEDWPPEASEALAVLRPPGWVEPPLAEPRRRPSNAVGTFARYPALAKAHFAVTAHILYSSSLSPRQRELLILRVGWLRRCDYEWAQHVRLAAEADITAEEIGWIVDGPARPEWNALDRALIQSADELLNHCEVSDPTWAVLAEHLNEQQCMDVMFIVGSYEVVAMLFRSYGVEPDDDLGPYLPENTGAWAGQAS
jgi:alkylhydroperoxidase family enzyme